MGSIILDIISRDVTVCNSSLSLFPSVAKLIAFCCFGPQEKKKRKKEKDLPEISGTNVERQPNTVQQMWLTAEYLPGVFSSSLRLYEGNRVVPYQPVHCNFQHSRKRSQHIPGASSVLASVMVLAWPLLFTCGNRTVSFGTYVLEMFCLVMRK